MSRLRRHLGNLTDRNTQVQLERVWMMLGTLPGAVLFLVLGASTGVAVAAGVALGFFGFGIRMRLKGMIGAREQRMLLLPVAALLMLACGTQAAVVAQGLPNSVADRILLMIGTAVGAVALPAALFAMLWQIVQTLRGVRPIDPERNPLMDAAQPAAVVSLAVLLLSMALDSWLHIPGAGLVGIGIALAAAFFTGRACYLRLCALLEQAG